MELFGIEIKRAEAEKKKGQTIAPPKSDDGAIEVESTEAGINFASSMGYGFDLDNVPSDEYELTTNYRNLALQLEIDEAIQEICNEAIITDEFKQSVEIVLDEVDTSDAIKNKIRDEFEHILKLLKFKHDGYGIFRKWYIDGKLLYHKVVDGSSANKGLVDLIQLDPLNVKLVREFKKTRNAMIDLYELDDIEEYFIYSERPFGDARKEGANRNQGLRIHRDAIAYVPSGLLSADGKMVLSHLYKAIKPYNNLKLMEDSVVIYRVTRAPERRIFYVDVGNLPKGKAEQYLKDTMNRFKNKIVYDVNKGTINNRKKFQSMMEDYWLPRREGGKGTEVSTLPGGQNLGELEDVEYFSAKMYKSLNVPLSRFQQESSAFNIGRTTEITRDEIKFSKFITRMRNKFSMLFDDLLKTQLVLKKVITPEDWENWKEDVSYDFLEDNYFQELKTSEILKDRLETLQLLQGTEIVGKYISHDTVRRNILQQSEDDIKDEDKKMKDEENDPRWSEDFGEGEDDDGIPPEPEQPESQPVHIVDDPESKSDAEAKPEQDKKPINKDNK